MERPYWSSPWHSPNPSPHQGVGVWLDRGDRGRWPDRFQAFFKRTLDHKLEYKINGPTTCKTYGCCPHRHRDSLPLVFVYKWPGHIVRAWAETLDVGSDAERGSVSSCRTWVEHQRWAMARQQTGGHIHSPQSQHSLRSESESLSLCSCHIHSFLASRGVLAKVKASIPKHETQMPLRNLSFNAENSLLLATKTAIGCFGKLPRHTYRHWRHTPVWLFLEGWTVTFDSTSAGQSFQGITHSLSKKFHLWLWLANDLCWFILLFYVFFIHYTL